MTSDPVIRIGAVVPRTRAEGPGTRFAVWVQGCSIRCDGCFNPHLWGVSGGTLTDVDVLVHQALSSGVEGVTLLGGEPFEQADACAVFAEGVREAGLSVMVFTGFELERIVSDDAPSSASRLLAATDLLVDGPYDADRPDHDRPWVGSVNQRFHFLTHRYAHLESDLTALPDRIEVRVKSTGEVAVNGWASVDVLDALLGRIGQPVSRGRIR